MKKTTLIQNLQKIVDNISKLDLPAQINAIYAFGSILREKENPHDMDLVILFTQTSNQSARWETFEKNFSDDYGSGHSIREIKDQLAIYQANGIPFSEAVKDQKLANVLREHEIEPNWAGCFSWTDVLGYDPYGFSPSLQKVLERMIFGKYKGFQVKFSGGEYLPDGYIPMMVAKNHCLAWNKDKPDVKTNLLARSVTDKISHDSKELKHFCENEIPRYKKEYQEAKVNSITKLEKLNFTANWISLEARHIAIQATDADSLTELARKCEEARIEMKNYHNEIVILNLIAYASNFRRKDYSVGKTFQKRLSKAQNLTIFLNNKQEKF